MKLDLSKFLDLKILINIKFFFIFLIFFATIIHLFFISNDIATLFVLILINISSIIVLNIFFNDLNLKFFFFPSLILFCANLFYFIFPLFFKTILFQSITSNLFLEEKTFYISFLYIMSITIAFKTISSYKDFYYKNENKLFNNFNIFQIPKLQSTNYCL